MPERPKAMRLSGLEPFTIDDTSLLAQYPVKGVMTLPALIISQSQVFKDVSLTSKRGQAIFAWRYPQAKYRADHRPDDQPSS